MKTIFVLAGVLLLNVSLSAQGKRKNAVPPPGDSYSLLKKCLRFQKYDHGIVSFSTVNPKRIAEPYWDLHQGKGLVDGESTATTPRYQSRRFMYFPGGAPRFNNSYRLTTSAENSSASVLNVLGFAGSIAASFLYPSYVGSIYHNNGAAVEAYLQSTYHQHDK